MARVPRVYLDTCALNRLVDLPSQQRIELESAAVFWLLYAIESGRIAWIASSVLVAEIEENPSSVRRRSLLAVLRLAKENYWPNDAVARRGRALFELGYGKADALHLAMAEEYACDVLLTTDDRFLRKAQRQLGNPSVQVENPLNYVKETRL